MHGWGGECDFHAAGFFGFEVDVGWGAVEADADGFEFGFEESALFCLFGGIENHHDHVGGL